MEDLEKKEPKKMEETKTNLSGKDQDKLDGSDQEKTVSKNKKNAQSKLEDLEKKGAKKMEETKESKIKTDISLTKDVENEEKMNDDCEVIERENQ